MKMSFSLRSSLSLFFVPLVLAALGLGACRSSSQPKADSAATSSPSNEQTNAGSSQSEFAKEVAQADAKLPSGYPSAPLATRTVVQF